MKPYKIVDLIQGSPEWHTWRRCKITASMSATIMGLNPYETPLQLFNKILSGKESPDNEAMQHGRNTEQEARQWLSVFCECKYRPACMESIEHSWLACSLDCWDEYCAEGIQCKSAEIKCPLGEKNRIYDFADIPSHYYAQLQHQMAVTGEPKMIFLSYSKIDQGGVVITVKRDDLFIEKMIPQLKTFYDRLASFDPPDPIDGRDIFILDDPEASNAASLYRQNKNLIEQLEKDNEELKNLMIRKAEGKSVRIRDLKVTKVLRRGNVDYSSIPCLQGYDLEPYRKPPIESWRIS